jgi:hypothetical protein
MAGVNLRAVQELMGHKTIKMTMRYSHLSRQHLQEAVGLLGLSLSGEMQEAASPFPMGHTGDSRRHTAQILAAIEQEKLKGNKRLQR